MTQDSSFTSRSPNNQGYTGTNTNGAWSSFMNGYNIGGVDPGGSGNGSNRTFSWTITFADYGRQIFYANVDDSGAIYINGNYEMGMGGFNALRALSTRNETPKTASRPFDAERDGFVLGEGSGALILEEYEHAVKRGAKIYAEVVGGGLTADAYHMTAPHPEGLGAKNVMITALEDANLTINDIDYINVTRKT